jgi:hypothetical protein
VLVKLGQVGVPEEVEVLGGVVEKLTGQSLIQLVPAGRTYSNTLKIQ